MKKKKRIYCFLEAVSGIIKWDNSKVITQMLSLSLGEFAVLTLTLVDLCMRSQASSSEKPATCS